MSTSLSANGGGGFNAGPFLGLGTESWIAGGGGGGTYRSAGGLGLHGGGDAAQAADEPGDDGQPNTGGGGGARMYSNIPANEYAGGSGGSGLVVIRFLIPSEGFLIRISAADQQRTWTQLPGRKARS